MRDHLIREELRADARGHLYDPAVRESLTAIDGDADVSELEALAALRLAAKQARTGFERWLERHGLSESRFRVLLSLYLSPDHHRALHELADRLDVVPRTITDVVDVLERDGLIRRMPDGSDRRSVHAQLTPAGVALVDMLKRDAVAQQAATFAGFTPEQLGELRHLCLLMVDRLRQAGG